MKDFEALDAGIRSKAVLSAKETAKKAGYKAASEYIIALYSDQKLSAPKIADIVGVKYQTILQWLARWGVEKRPSGGNTKNLELKRPGVREEILSLKGIESTRKVAKKFGCSTQFVRNIWGPVEKKEPKPRAIAERKKAIEKEVDGRGLETKHSSLSTRRGRGISQANWERNKMALELAAWRAHKGEKRVPLHGGMLRLGDVRI